MRKLLLLCCLLGLVAPAAHAENKVLMMATTTSTNDTGLLDDMAPLLLKETGIELRWTSVGTGKALEMGKNCDVDVLLVHSPAAEAKFVEAGSGIERTQLMYNDFVIVGPVSDPAKVKGKNVADTLTAIAAGKLPFISRGDSSGTHNAEVALWKGVGMSDMDKHEWYVSAGQGMLRTLAIAGEKGGYTVTDRGTWNKYESTLKEPATLQIITEGDSKLFNQYSAIAVNPAQCPKAKVELARAFTKWMASPAIQTHIGAYKLNGKPLFTPNAGK